MTRFNQVQLNSPGGACNTPGVPPDHRRIEMKYKSIPSLPPEAVERFWAKVDKSGECWEWLAHKTDCGYGRISIGGEMLSAHRVSWSIHFGPIPPGLCVCHKCDNKLCVNPSHLFLGTITDNNRDKSAKGRHHNQKTHCIRGHEFTPENTAIYADVRNATGVVRRCRECYRQYDRAKTERKRTQTARCEG